MTLQMQVQERSLHKIRKRHLLRLRDIALEDQSDFFIRKPLFAEAYKGRLFGIALCQGAGLHYVNGTNGLKDFDVWSFYLELVEAEYKKLRWDRRLKSVESGLGDFGVHPYDKRRGLTSRHVDLLVRSLPNRFTDRYNNDPVLSLQSYLLAQPTDSA